MKHLVKLATMTGATVLLSSIAINAHAWSFFKYKPAPTDDLTITEIVAASGDGFDRKGSDYDILLAAVKAAGLDGTLASDEIDVSVLAPNDSAFIKLARDLGYEGRREDGAFNTIFDTLLALNGGNAEGAIATLTNILLYHVLPSSQSKVSIIFGGEQATLLEGATILPIGRQLVDNDPEFRNPKLNFWKKGRKASNGIVHGIDRVLIPADLPAPGQSELPSITEAVVASGGEFDSNHGDFDILLNAVLFASDANNPGSVDLASLLAGEGQFAVFAPTDAAFIRLVNDLGVAVDNEADAFATIAAALPGLTGIDDLAAALVVVLTYHVNVAEEGATALTIKDVLTADTVGTALGAEITPNGRALGDLDPDLRDPRLILRQGNILLNNGRIHPINRVLIPADL